MKLPTLLHHLPLQAAARTPARPALVHGQQVVSYGELASAVEQFSAALAARGLARGSRVAIWLDKRVETVVAAFGAAAAGCVMVPINPLLKAQQVRHVLSDCGASVLVSTTDRAASLAAAPEAAALPPLMLVDSTGPDGWAAWHTHGSPQHTQQEAIDTDVAALLYTSGSTGAPKGVVLSHRNLVAGAGSVAGYLENCADDVLLAALPLSFDAGFSQLTTAFLVGAKVVLHNYFLPADALKLMARERVTGLTAVPPLYLQLSSLAWPEALGDTLRYFANTGGHMPTPLLQALRAKVPRAQPFLMYGLTEAFRSTYLPPQEVDRRPSSIGRAIPNVEILVLREDGSECAPGEPGELVHRGPLVSLGYWGDPARTAERFRELPTQALPGQPALPRPELAVFSGDTVYRDEEGFLYFVGRRDDMIKSSGYRISPTEVEESLYASGLIGECAAFGVAHEALGQAVHVAVCAHPGQAAPDAAAVLSHCRRALPAYMVPARIHVVEGPLPRNANGKVDRLALRERLATAA